MTRSSYMRVTLRKRTVDGCVEVELEDYLKDKETGSEALARLETSADIFMKRRVKDKRSDSRASRRALRNLADRTGLYPRDGKPLPLTDLPFDKRPNGVAAKAKPSWTDHLTDANDLPWDTGPTKSSVTSSTTVNVTARVKPQTGTTTAVDPDHKPWTADDLEWAEAHLRSIQKEGAKNTPFINEVKKQLAERHKHDQKDNVHVG